MYEKPFMELILFPDDKEDVITNSGVTGSELPGDNLGSWEDGEDFGPQKKETDIKFNRQCMQNEVCQDHRKECVK